MADMILKFPRVLGGYKLYTLFTKNDGTHD